jgi:hypothetical protein
MTQASLHSGKRWSKILGSKNKCMVKEKTHGDFTVSCRYEFWILWGWADIIDLDRPNYQQWWRGDRGYLTTFIISLPEFFVVKLILEIVNSEHSNYMSSLNQTYDPTVRISFTFFHSGIEVSPPVGNGSEKWMHILGTWKTMVIRQGRVDVTLILSQQVLNSRRLSRQFRFYRPNSLYPLTSKYDTSFDTTLPVEDGRTYWVHKRDDIGAAGDKWWYNNLLNTNSKFVRLSRH